MTCELCNCKAVVFRGEDPRVFTESALLQNFHRIMEYFCHVSHASVSAQFCNTKAFDL